VRLSTPGLDKIIKALGGKAPVARVGILGQKVARGAGDGGTQKKSAGSTNAVIGAAHEFGTSKLPQRSFLRIPISMNLKKNLAEAGLTDKDTLKEVIASGTVKPWLEKVAIEAVGIVLEAFDTGGDGLWLQSNMKRKKNHQTLVETQQLRNSISYEVE
jgi:hypothetical protein